jgi:nicotinate-nucleotide pyrophosphorylase
MDLPLQLAAEVQRNVLAALAEDIGGGDLTALLSPGDKRSQGTVVSREDAVLAGTAWFDSCFRRLDPLTEIRWNMRDGDTIGAGEVVCEIEANTRTLLTAERAALNFLQTALGHGHRHAALRRCHRRHRRAHRRHAQDPTRPAPGTEIRRHLRRRQQPPPRSP